MKKHLIVTGIALWICTERSFAIDIEPMGKAVGAVLGTSKQVFKKTLPDKRTFFYSKAAPGKIAFIEDDVYKPNCKHRWVVGMGPGAKVTEIHFISVDCPHALPINTHNFLDQFKGKGPADVKKFRQTINTVAKATASAQMTSDAAARAIKSYPQAMGIAK